jgi:hypothetical protein
VRGAGLWTATRPRRNRPAPGVLRSNCRQAARRARVRAEEQAAERATRLAQAKATADRMLPAMEQAGRRAVPGLAGLVLAAAADPGRPRAEADQGARELVDAAYRPRCRRKCPEYCSPPGLARLTAQDRPRKSDTGAADCHLRLILPQR